MSELIPLDLINPNPYQPREREDAEHVRKIALSIAEQGLLQVPVGRGVGERVELAFGHTRLAAYKWLLETDELAGKSSGWTRMPIELRQLSDLEMFEMGVSENLARKDLTALEEARAMKRYKDDFSKTSAEIGQLFGLGDSAVRNKIRLLNLPAECQQALSEGTLLEGAARELLSLYDLPAGLREQAESDYEYGEGEARRPSTIIRKALAGASAEYVSEAITRILKSRAYSLSEKTWKDEWVSDDPYYKTLILGPCKGCQFMVTRKGTPYCTRLQCYNAKNKAWQREYLQKASKACGIPVLEVNIDRPSSLDSYDDPGGKIKQSKCQNLRLDYLTDAKHISGHPHAKIVCVKQNGACACVKGIKAVKSQVNQTETWREQEKRVAEAVQELTPEMLAEQARQARIAKRNSWKQVDGIRERLQKLILESMLSYSLPGWMAVLEEISSNKARELRKAGKDQDLQAIYAAIASDVAARMMPDSYMLEQSPDPAGYALRHLNEDLGELGLPMLTMMDLDLPIHGEEEAGVPVQAETFAEL